MFNNFAFTEIILIAGQIFGGVGIFLLAIWFLSDGLKDVGSHALRRILQGWTKTPVSAVGLGAVVTILLQSSSASTAILISLVNASLIPLLNAIWVVLGANIGTTMTGWIVSFVGLDFDIKNFALPFIGFGMFLHLMFPKTRKSALGMALTGFGLFFIGIDILRESFSGFAQQAEFSSITQTGLFSLLALVGAGFLMTVLTQSSSAAISLILTSAAGGLFDLSAGAALVIGANLGTTSTAIISVLGANPNAKRLAAAHVLFNLCTAILALAMLPILLIAVVKLEILFGIQPTIMASLAMLHTVFNLMGVIVLAPLVPYGAKKLELLFHDKDEEDSKPRYLDKTHQSMPSIALGALDKELERFKILSCNHALAVLSAPSLDLIEAKHLLHKREALANLSSQIAQFAGGMAQSKTARDTSRALQLSLRINRYLQQLAALSIDGYQLRLNATKIKDSEARKEVEKFLRQCEIILQKIEKDEALPKNQLQKFLKDYKKTKSRLLELASNTKIDIDLLSSILDHMTRVCRMGEQAIKAHQTLAKLKGVFHHGNNKNNI